MTKVHLTTPEQCQWVVSGQRKLSEKERADLRQGELTSEYQIREVGAGGCLYIAGRTFYGFHAGPNGLHILNFRPRAEATFNLPPARARDEART